MEYKLRPLDAQVSLPTVTLPVTDDLPALAGQDYLAVVNSLFVKFERCAILAARNCGVSCDMGTIVFPPQPERSEEHTSELQSLMRISYAVFCLKKKKTK